MPKPQSAKPGEARAIGQHHFEMFDRHRLGLRGAMDVDELREHEFDLVLAQQCSALRLRSLELSPAFFLYDFLQVFRHR